MGISSSADFADDFDEPELTSQVIAPARPRTPSPSFHSGPPPTYDSATKKVLGDIIMIVLNLMLSSLGCHIKQNLSKYIKYHNGALTMVLEKNMIRVIQV